MADLRDLMDDLREELGVPYREFEPRGMTAEELAESIARGYGGRLWPEWKPEEVSRWKPTPGKKERVGAIEQLKRTDIRRLFPFQPYGAMETYTLMRAAKRQMDNDYEPGDYRVTQDRNLLVDSFNRMVEQRDRKLSIGGWAANIVPYLPGYMAEFIVTGGLLGKVGLTAASTKGAKAVLTQIATKGARKAGLQAAAKATLKTMATAAAREVIMPHRVAEAAFHRLTPEFGKSPEGQFFVREARDKPLTAITKALADVYVEMLTEEAGAAIGAGLSAATGKVIGKVKGTAIGKLLKNTKIAGVVRNSLNKIRGAWMNRTGGTAGAFYRAAVEQGRFHGLIEEFGEERLGDLLRGVFALQGEGPMHKRIWENMPGIRQAVAEFGSFAVIPLAGMGIRAAAGRITPETLPTLEEAEIAKGVDPILEASSLNQLRRRAARLNVSTTGDETALRKKLRKAMVDDIKALRAEFPEVETETARAATIWTRQNPEEAAELAKKEKLSRRDMENVLPGLRWNAQERSQFHASIKRTIKQVTAEEVADAIQERGPAEILVGEPARAGAEVGARIREPEAIAEEGVPPTYPSEAERALAGRAAAAEPGIAPTEAEARAARIAAPEGVAPEAAVTAAARAEAEGIAPPTPTDIAPEARRVPLREYAEEIAEELTLEEQERAARVIRARPIPTLVEAAREQFGEQAPEMLRRQAQVLAKYPDVLTAEDVAKIEAAANFAESVQEPVEPGVEPRRPLAEYGQKVTPELPVAVAPTIDREAVIKAFPGTQVTRLPRGEGFRVELPSGRFFTIRGKADIPVDWEAAEAAAGRKFTQAERDNLAAAGAVQLNLPDGTATDGMGVILISQRVGQPGLIRHEALHLARQAGFFTDSEWNALVNKHSAINKAEAQQEEDIANSRYVTHKARSLWTQLKSWFRKILDTLGLKPIDAKSVETLMESSAFWARRPDIRGGQRAQSLVRRPELAIPVVTPEARGLVEEVDIARAEAGIPERRPDAEVQAEAETRLNANYQGEVQRLKEIANRGGQLNEVDTLIAKTILNREATQAIQSNDPVALKDAMALIDSYRRTGTEQARAFRQRYDPVESPVERRTRMLNEALLTPNRTDKEALDAAHAKGDMAEIERIRDKTVKAFDKMRQGLLDMEIDIDNLDAHLQTPESAARVLGSIRAAKADWWDAQYEFWANAILSLPTTQAANIIGNTVPTFMHFTAQRFVEAAANTYIKAPGGAQWGEFRHILAGVMPGLIRGARNFARTWKTETPFFEQELGRVPTTKLDTPRIAIKGKWGRFVRSFGYRLLLAADEFAKSLIAEMEVGAQAYRIAKAEGLNGEQMAERMMNLVNDIQSQAWSAAIDTSIELTYQKRGGKITETILNARRKIPGFRYIVPFVTTPMNIFRIGIRKSPFGVTPMAIKIYKAIKTNNWNDVPIAAAEQILAWAAVLLLLGNNEDDPWITGALPEMEKGPREMGRRTYEPMSIIIGGRAFSYARLEPLATTIALTVDTLNAVKRGDPVKMITLPYKALVGQVKNKTFLRGLGDFVNMVENPNPKGLARWASSLAASFIPNLIRGAGRAARENYPERGVWGRPSEWFKRLGKRTFQRTEILPIKEYPRYDLWGRPAKRHGSPVPYTDWLWRITIPIRTKEIDIFIADRLLVNWNYQHPEKEAYPSQPSKFYTRQGERIYWTDEQYAEYSRIAGEIAREAIEKNADKLKPDKPTAANIKWLRGVIRRARGIAKRRVLSKR